MSAARLRKFYDLPDGQMSALHFGDVTAPVRLIFLHANGFNGLSYKTVLSGLGVHAVAFDLRGHGMSELPADPAALRDWHIFRDDILHVMDTAITGRVVVAGHSYGAVTGILLAPFLKDRMVGYVGFDPVTIPQPVRAISKTAWGSAYLKKRLTIARNAGRRKSRFDSLQAAFERYQNRGAFRGFTDEALRDYLTGGLVPDVKGGVKLACDPLWEQAIFTAQGHNLFKAARGLPRGNSAITFASKYGAVSYPASRRALARHIGKDNVVLRKDFAHMFPLHDPDFARAQLEAAIESAQF